MELVRGNLSEGNGKFIGGKLDGVNNWDYFWKYRYDFRDVS